MTEGGQSDGEAEAEEPDLEEELSRQKEIKVKLPMEMYLKLHQHKIINGELLKDVVQDALDGYLEELEEDAKKEA